MEEYKLQDYVPKIYEDILEMDKLIDAEQIVFDEAIDDLANVKDNAFITSSDVERIRQYEKLLKIKASPSTEDLAFRQERVLNRMSTRPPFTIKWLKEKLSVFLGEDNYKITYHPNEYYIYIKVKDMSDETDKELRETLSATLPMNMSWYVVENPYTTYGELKDALITHNELSLHTYEEIKTLL